jgi:apolipoprotein N-acyltransferase
MPPDEPQTDACPLPAAATAALAAPDRSQGSEGAGSPDGSEGGRLAAAIYVGISFVAALVFWLVTTFAGSYGAVARYGGAVWVFILFMIVLMPIVIPRVRNRSRRKATARTGMMN